MSRENIFNILPDEVINLILSEISYNDLKSVNRSSQAMRGIIRENNLIENKLIEFQRFLNKIDLRGWTEINNNFSNDYFNVIYKNNEVNIQIKRDNILNYRLQVNEFKIYINKFKLVIIEPNIIHIFTYSDWFSKIYHRFDIQKYSTENLIKIFLNIHEILLIFKKEENEGDESINTEEKKDNYMLKLKEKESVSFSIDYFDNLFIIYNEANKYYLALYNKFGVYDILYNEGRGWMLCLSYPQLIDESLDLVAEIRIFLNNNHLDENAYKEIKKIIEEIDKNIKQYMKFHYGEE
jgi:hypothetical protein